MKFLHEMMSIFRTEFSAFWRRGLGHIYLQDGLQFPPSWLENHSPSFVPVFIELIERNLGRWKNIVKSDKNICTNNSSAKNRCLSKVES